LLNCPFTNCHFALGCISLCALRGPPAPFALFIGRLFNVVYYNNS